ncbi:hypothetical protein [Streptomyces djakartensis]|uniref:Uncharacterized protein n=1 Tax=Streptomyces djakartensis TaxID=68193 RepID=A0ABQ2ZQ37_9ACTN|nr:hypothetical protein [Streptomyces djakartensis]GGY19489.1 hypothetical protein GCM10010384_27310 [Streptomyces djakartensis]
MLQRTRTAERYARGLTAAAVAIATLLLAGNAGPARAAGPPEPTGVRFEAQGAGDTP